MKFECISPRESSNISYNFDNWTIYLKAVLSKKGEIKNLKTKITNNQQKWYKNLVTLNINKYRQILYSYST